MMRALLSVRFRALFAGMTQQGKKKKKRNTGTIILFVILYLYVAVVICGMMGFLFFSLAEPYHTAGLDWLYFAMAGLMGLGFSIFGSVFATQNQLYDAKDNNLLLSMPIPPRMILMSRMLPLLVLNLLFTGIVMVPAIVVYAIQVQLSIPGILAQILSVLGITVLSQAIACLFGWLLHLMLSKMNKSVASMLYMILFLGVYFSIYSQANKILASMAANGQAIAATLQTWVWPLYAMGQGCVDNILSLLLFLLIACGLFAVVYAILSVTFLHTATMRSKGRSRRKLNLGESRVSSPINAVTGKEWKKFLGCPVYLTNMGLGVILCLVLPVAGIIFRRKLMPILQVPELGGFLTQLLPLLICAMIAFLISTMCVSTPSVSLEGKSLWILKSMPLTSKQILLAKLRFHCILTIPVSCLAALVLAITYGCSPVDSILSAVVCGLLSLLCGIIGMVSGLKWARMDYISEAYPCKQSASVLVTMFSMMGVPILLGVLYGSWLMDLISVSAFLGICCILLAAVCFGFYRLLITWGIRKWESL